MNCACVKKIKQMVGRGTAGKHPEFEKPIGTHVGMYRQL